MSFFLTILNVWMAEKMLILLYVAGMAFSFRYLVKQINPDNPGFSLLIFPFIYSFLFRLGFYNFSIAFIFCFLALGFWLKNHDKFNFRNVFLLFLVITCLYYSNVLIYGFTGLAIGFHIIVSSVYVYHKNREMRHSLRFFSKHIALILSASIFSLILMYLFYSKVAFFPTADRYPPHQLLKWINDVKPLIVYGYLKEEPVTEQFLHLLIILLGLRFFGKHVVPVKDKNKLLIALSILFFPFVLSIAALFAIPQGAGAGMMSERFLLMLYIYLIAVLAAISLRSMAGSIVMILFLALHFYILCWQHFSVIRYLDRDAVTVFEAGEQIRENSVVLPVDLSDNWLHKHFSSYLGLKKPTIILDNYEASMGWFPLKWKREDMPYLMLGEKTSLNTIEWEMSNNIGKQKKIDYICTTGNIEKLKDPEWEELREVIEKGFRLSYVSDDAFVHIFEKL
jgi:hypothetical protein